jgi:hypothetical protein
MAPGTQLHVAVPHDADFMGRVPPGYMRAYHERVSGSPPPGTPQHAVVLHDEAFMGRGSACLHECVGARMMAGAYEGRHNDGGFGTGEMEGGHEGKNDGVRAWGQA